MAKCGMVVCTVADVPDVLILTHEFKVFLKDLEMPI